MLTSTKLVAAMMVAGMTAGAVNAATISASGIVDYGNPSLNEYIGSTTTSGTSTTARANLTNVLGDADGRFYSLGKLGFLVLSFGSPTQPFSGATVVVEYGSGGSGATDREQAEVYVGNDVLGLKNLAFGDTSNSLSVGHIGSNSTATFNIAGGPWTYLLIKDTSMGGNSTYGVDIDAVRVTPAFGQASVESVAVPLPASVWGGLAMMGLLGAKRIRRKLRAGM